VTRAGTVIWITGLSGAGKSTLADVLCRRLRGKAANVVLVDGDAIRELLDAPGLDRASRLNIARFNARLCRFLASQGQHVVCATISLFREIHQWNRDNISNYVEVFLDVSMEALRARDPKNIYSQVQQGIIANVVGVDIPAEFPESPHLVFTEGEGLSPDQMADRVIRFAKLSSLD
jgi:cytidine diphosphoramidate kinase